MLISLGKENNWREGKLWIQSCTPLRNLPYIISGHTRGVGWIHTDLRVAIDFEYYLIFPTEHLIVVTVFPSLGKLVRAFHPPSESGKRKTLVASVKNSNTRTGDFWKGQFGRRLVTGWHVSSLKFRARKTAYRPCWRWAPIFENFFKNLEKKT